MAAMAYQLANTATLRIALAKSLSQRGGRITDGVWQILARFATNDGLFYRTTSVPVLLAIFGQCIHASQWSAIENRLRESCQSCPKVKHCQRLEPSLSPSSEALVSSETQDSQTSTGTQPRSQSQQDSACETVCPISDSGALTTIQLLNRCVHLPPDLFCRLIHGRATLSHQLQRCGNQKATF